MGMLLAPQITAIIMLLTAFGVDPIITADVQRILEGRPAITSTATTTTMTSAQPPASAPSSSNGAATPRLAGNEGTTLAPAPVVATAPASRARIDVISPTPGNGLNRKHTTSPELDNDGKGNPMNEMVIAAVLYGDDGRTAIKDAIMTITATDSVQNKTMNGTGEIHPVYVDGQKTIPPIYTYYYVFKTAGDHTITFSSNGISQSVTVKVSE